MVSSLTDEERSPDPPALADQVGERPAPAFVSQWLDGSAPHQVARWTTWLTGVVLFVLAVAVHLALSRHMRAPIVQADEFGYLDDAHYLARGGPGPGMPYTPGYSLLLVPLWWLSSSTATVYRWALELNALLAGATVVLMYLLGRRLRPAVRPAVLVAAVVAVAAYPSFLLVSNIAEAENLLIPGFVCLCLLMLRAGEAPTPANWAAAGAAAGLLVMVHPRALVAAVAVALVAVVALRPWRRHWDALAATGASLGAALLVSELVTRAVTRVTPSEHLARYATSPIKFLTRSVSGSAMARVGATLSGELLYLLVGSAGLFALGALSLWRSRSAGHMRHRARPMSGQVALFMALTAAGSAVLAALVLEDGTRLDNIVYGRYLEAFAAPVLLLGALAGGRLAGRGRWDGALMALTWTAVGLGATAGGLVLYWGSDRTGPVQVTNSMAWEALFHLSSYRLMAAVFAGVALAVSVIVLGAYRGSAAAGTVALLVAFAPSSAYAYSDLVSQSAGAANEGLLPRILLAVQSKVPVSCVAWDEATEDPFNFFNSRLYDPALHFKVFDSDSHQAPCGPLVVSSRNLAAKAPFSSYRMVLLGHSSEAVWVGPGPVQYALGVAGWLLPRGFPAPLLPGSQQGSIRLDLGSGRTASTGRVVVPRATPTTVALQVTHTGAGSPWPDAGSVGRVPQYAVRVAVAWYHGGNDTQEVATGRADLPDPLLPGQSTTLTAVLDPIGPTGLSLLPGPYDVRISLIQESVGDFGATIPPVWLHVTVGG